MVEQWNFKIFCLLWYTHCCTINIKNLRMTAEGGGRPLRPSLDPPLLTTVNKINKALWNLF